jgi:hypothetical protein
MASPPQLRPRSHVYVRPLDPLNQADLAAFVAATEHAGRTYPSGVFTLPSTGVMVAEKRESHGIEIIAYQPHYLSLVMGSITIPGKPSELELASAQHQFTASAYTRAHTDRLADILMFTNTPDTAAFASRHDFGLTHTAYRMEVR